MLLKKGSKEHMVGIGIYILEGGWLVCLCQFQDSQLGDDFAPMTSGKV